MKVFGYDMARLHSALNDLPAALLLASVLFDLLGAINRRDTLKAAGFWCLVLGVLGAGAAVATGLIAEGRVEHTGAAHGIMQTHKTISVIVTVLFALLLAWRLVRRGMWSDRETPVALTAGVIGISLMVVAARLGGSLVFDHGLGVPTSRLRTIVEERGGSVGPPPADSSTAGAGAGTAGTHRHSDGTEHRH